MLYRECDAWLLLLTVLLRSLLAWLESYMWVHQPTCNTGAFRQGPSSSIGNNDLTSQVNIVKLIIFLVLFNICSLVLYTVEPCFTITPLKFFYHLFKKKKKLTICSFWPTFFSLNKRSVDFSSENPLNSTSY